MAKRQSRIWTSLGATLVVGLVLAWAFWPQPTLVDMAAVHLGPMQVTLNEEARTRVRDAYLVSAPIAGRLLRVDAEAGDAVVQGETVIARMLPIPASALDVRSREQALAAISSAEATLKMARADFNRAQADQELAGQEESRVRQLFDQQIATRAELDNAVRNARAQAATLDTARAAIAMRESELAGARARLISFNEPAARQGERALDANTIPLTAPVSGSVLQILQKSETVVAAGTPILEIGDTGRDLEVVVELLSSDAVRSAAGMRVIIDNWGGDHSLEGRVERIEPWGFTKYSALGVEEQRVRGIIRFSSPEAQRSRLGHGYRVEVGIVLWESETALIAPASALFRDGEQWAVFVVENQRARYRAVNVRQNNGVSADIAEGLQEGDMLVLYPGPDLRDGSHVAQRVVE
ncbi:MAG TPA: HlyD family efflux transporter periplasmic adaptor subunit [Pseudomonadaceae bacterium]|nr:HlyD family efflux transporter periplasmic adaptor subunit [Pseudomonadaceae bacterium]